MRLDVENRAKDKIQRASQCETMVPRRKSISVEGQEVNQFPGIKGFGPVGISYNGLHIEVTRSEDLVTVGMKKCLLQWGAMFSPFPDAMPCISYAAYFFALRKMATVFLKMPVNFYQT